MWKQLSAMVRGRSFEAVERVADANALTILRQQIRDCAEAVTAARKAVAVAVAQDQAEAQVCRRLDKRIEDLETRALAALEQGKDELAREAAEALAHLQAERAASETAQAASARQIERLKRVVATSETRLRDLQRGQRLAAAVARTQRLSADAPCAPTSNLRDAEETLDRLRRRQKETEAVSSALDEMMEGPGGPEGLSRKLAAAGCGAPLRAGADAILERLRARMSAAQPG